MNGRDQTQSSHKTENLEDLAQFVLAGTDVSEEEENDEQDNKMWNWPLAMAWFLVLANITERAAIDTRLLLAACMVYKLMKMSARCIANASGCGDPMYQFWVQ